MIDSINLCTSTLPNVDFLQSLEIAEKSGYQGIELRLHDDYHVSLADMLSKGDEIVDSVKKHNLELSVFNTYISIFDVEAVDALITVSIATGVRFVRLVLPAAGTSQVLHLSEKKAVVPSFYDNTDPQAIFEKVRKRLLELEKAVQGKPITFLLETHWGTIMSNFTSAYYLLKGIDPMAISITLDPANMIIEGSEDWEFGIGLIRDKITNVHIKNASWNKSNIGWRWRWSSLSEGMIDWPNLFDILQHNQYKGQYAMEDFRCPPAGINNAISHFAQLYTQTQRLSITEPAGIAI